MNSLLREAGQPLCGILGFDPISDEGNFCETLPHENYSLQPFNFLERPHAMLMTIAIVLLILWALGLVTSATMGGLIHILLVVAVVIILVRLIQGRRVV